jgi:hypothetical protein
MFFLSSFLLLCRTTGLQHAIPNGNGKSVSYIAASAALSINQLQFQHHVFQGARSLSLYCVQVPSFRPLYSTIIDIAREPMGDLLLHIACFSVTTLLALRCQGLQDVLKKKLYR